MNNFLCGYLIGALSLIPGISGGTVLFLTEYFDKFTYAIANIFNKQIRKENAALIITFLIGIIAGALTCAKVIELLFTYIPYETMLFIGVIVLFTLPTIYQERMKEYKLNFWYFALGILIIAILSSKFINLDNVIITKFPKLTIVFLISFAISGFIDGFITILPGISGSMIMMILGPYFLYKSYLANLDFQHFNYLIPLIFYFLGDMLGVIYGSKASCYLLKNYYQKTMSIIIGMVLASALAILPLNSILNFNGIIKTLLITLFAFILCNFKKIKKVL